MSSIFDLDERIRRLRETLSHLRSTALSDTDEIGVALKTPSDARAREDWAKFVAELRDFLAAAETLATRPITEPSAIPNPLSGWEMAASFRSGATLH